MINDRVAYLGELVRVFHSYKIYGPESDGGIPTVICDLVRNKYEAASHSILSARRFGFGRDYVVDGIPVKAVASLGTLFSTPVAPFYIPAFLRSARNTNIVVHHAPFPLTDIAILFGLQADVALIVYWHADIAAYPKLKRFVAPIVRRVLARADKIVVSGTAMIENSEILRPFVEKCEVLPYGVNLDYWRMLNADDLEEVEQTKREKPRHVLAVGRLVSYKGFDVLIRAMRHVDAQATIVGEGAQYDDLKRLINELGVADRVHLAGRLSRREIKILFHSTDVLAFPSINEAEAFGIVQIEAMATGLPIVNTQLRTTVPWVARHNQEALTVRPNDPNDLATALNTILNQPDLAKRLGASASNRATEVFDEDFFRKRMREIYDNALRARKAHA